MGSALTPEEILEDFRSYYYETALSSLGSNMACMDAFVSPSRLLFGSDFPGQDSKNPLSRSLLISPLAVNVEMANWYTKNIKEHYAEDSGRLEMVMGGNAFNLFPILRDRHWSQIVDNFEAQTAREGSKHVHASLRDQNKESSQLSYSEEFRGVPESQGLEHVHASLQDQNTALVSPHEK
ncbi:hypothetical protein H0H93_015549 [Arthromyces matolae]|nr:hypothetical protein H0H93_015549 [Arthromyces matolae]